MARLPPGRIKGEQSVRRVVAALIAATDARHRGTQDHSDRVMTYAVEVAKRLGVNGSRLDRLRLAAELHDVGKFAVPESILAKPGRITTEEFDQIKTHAEAGEQILRAADLLEVAEIVRSHHERWDGSGYPDGLAAEKIPLESRIIVGTDSLDAMTAHRSYREPLTIEQAREEIERCAGTHFDPAVAEAMAAMIDTSVVTSVAPSERRRD